MTKSEIIDDLIDTLDHMEGASSKQTAKHIYQYHLEWIDIEEAKKTNFEPGLIILSNGQVPFFPCFWVEDKQAWVRRIEFMSAEGRPETMFNKIKNPTHFRALPPIP